MSGDNSSSARARRAQLQAELAEAQQELSDTYYDRSVQNQQDALDKEQEAFTKEKEAEMEKWDEYLEDVEKVVADSLAIIQDNTDAVYNTITEMGQEYGLNITDAITDPWKKGEDAIQDYSEKFKLSMSATIEELQKLAEEHKKFMDELATTGQDYTGQVGDNSKKYQDADKKPDDKKDSDDSKKKKSFKKGDKVRAGKNKLIYANKGDKKGAKQYYADDPVYIVTKVDGNWIQVRHHTKKKVAGWFHKPSLSAYATGTTGVPKDQLALIDELGEELVIRPQNGRMAFLEKGTGVIPAGPTENLMKWGNLDPTDMLARNKPEIAMSPSVVNNTMEVNMEIAEVVHIDTVTNDTIPNLTKAIEKQMDKYMKGINANIRKYAR